MGKSYQVIPISKRFTGARINQLPSIHLYFLESFLVELILDKYPDITYVRLDSEDIINLVVYIPFIKNNKIEYYNKLVIK